MKKQLPTHDDAPSTPLPPKVIEVEAPNYEGDTRSSKYEVDENRPLDTTSSQPVSKSPRVEPYPWPDDDIDLYAVDTRIWDRIGEMGGDGGGPHTHTQYSLTDHTHDTTHTHTEYSATTHNHDGDYQPVGNYADSTHTHPEYEGGTGGSYDDTEVRALIQGNTDALDTKSDTTHTHPPQDLTHDHNGEYQPVGDYATNTDLANGLAGKSDTTHTHSDILAAVNSKWGMWTGTQAEYDALGTYNDNTLYVVV